MTYSPESQPWETAAMSLASLAEQDLDSNDQLTRMAGESRMAMARAELREAHLKIGHLKNCFSLEAQND